jgi:hypothetical protein
MYFQELVILLRFFEDKKCEYWRVDVRIMPTVSAKSFSDIGGRMERSPVISGDILRRSNYLNTFFYVVYNLSTKTNSVTILKRASHPRLCFQIPIFSVVEIFAIALCVFHDRWHISCLVCARCSVELRDIYQHAESKELLCRSHYLREFGEVSVRPFLYVPILRFSMSPSSRVLYYFLVWILCPFHWMLVLHSDTSTCNRTTQWELWIADFGCNWICDGGAKLI